MYKNNGIGWIGWLFIVLLFVGSFIWWFYSIQSCMTDLGFSWITCSNLLGIGK